VLAWSSLPLVGEQTLRGDAIVIALGAEYAPQAIPGLTEAGLCIYTLAGAGAIRDALARFDGGRIAVLTATPQYKCPAAPYEAALLLDSYLRERGCRDKFVDGVDVGLGGGLNDVGRGPATGHPDLAVSQPHDHLTEGIRATRDGVDRVIF